MKGWMLWIALLMGSAVCLQAQTNFISQFSQHPILINPAFAGHDGEKQFNIWNRNSYSRFTNVDFNTAWVAYQAPLNSEGQQGIGFQAFIEQEQFGFSETAGINGMYAYNLALDENTDFRLGLGMGAGRRADSIFVAGGGGVFGTDVNWYFSLNAGILLTSGNWEFGVGAYNANQPSYKTDFGTSRAVRQLLYGSIRYNYEVQEGLKVIPALLIKRVGQERTISLEGGVDLYLLDRFLLGAGLRMSRLGQSVYFINGLQYNTNINYLIARVGAELTENTSAYVSYDTPLRTNSRFQPAAIIFGYLEAGFTIKIKN